MSAGTHPFRIAVPDADPENPLPRLHRLDRTRWTGPDRGGQFAAVEEPDLVIADIRAFLGDLTAVGVSPTGSAR
ncbi:hypothetical protein ACIRS1_29705 [Kitasatospora sp. NPDC101176]|uniref:hypothetical protein n=1 Tax=Kitasatospora sp. NPDC101176 TaxID=3364099 RepID=UPI0037F18834